jgi:hypothetical protein
MAIEMKPINFLESMEMTYLGAPDDGAGFGEYYSAGR